MGEAGRGYPETGAARPCGHVATWCRIAQLLSSRHADRTARRCRRRRRGGQESCDDSRGQGILPEFVPEKTVASGHSAQTSSSVLTDVTRAAGNGPDFKWSKIKS
jgi:hypothetical protein